MGGQQAEPHCQASRQGSLAEFLPFQCDATAAGDRKGRCLSQYLMSPTGVATLES